MPSWRELDTLPSSVVLRHEAAYVHAGKGCSRDGRGDAGWLLMALGFINFSAGRENLSFFIVF